MKHIFTWLSHTPIRSLIEAELAEAEREQLRAFSACEYADSIVRYNAERIKRLRITLAKFPSTSTSTK